MAAEPQAAPPRLIGLWRQISARYASYPDTLYFELLNEPNNATILALNSREWTIDPYLADSGALELTLPKRRVYAQMSDSQRIASEICSTKH